MDLHSIDWTHVAAAAGGLAVGILPTARRVMRAYGKSKQELADEALADAVEKAKVAHADSDPSNDAAADAVLERARAIRAKAKILHDLGDALAAEPDKAGP